MEIPTIEKRLQVRNEPTEKPMVFQDWNDLFFFHWKYPADVIQKFLPVGLYVDTYQDEAYVGIIPFHISNFKPYIFPEFIRGMKLKELNVRTYVYDKWGMPGVWFFSLDATSLFMVEVSKFLFGLPYIYSTIVHSHNKDHLNYMLKRDNHSLNYDATLSSQIYNAAPGTLEFFLIERYLLFTLKKGKLYRGKVHHHPYPLQEVSNANADSLLLELDGLPPRKDTFCHALFSKGVKVKFYQPRFV